MKKLAVIPARYGSTRFEGKPLAKLCGKEMVIWVCEAVEKSGLFAQTIVATDDLRIYDVVMANGFRAMMTSKEHSNGTERCEEVLKRQEEQGNQYDVVVNVQGDEPMIKDGQLKQVLQSFEEDSTTQIATLSKRIEDMATLMSSNVVKIVTNRNTALYFSRAIIPFVRNITMEEGIKQGLYHKHIGLYAYRCDVLHNLVKLSQTPYERAENLEQLRWLENGYTIHVTPAIHDSYGVDTPSDLISLEQMITK